jgi:hypothetical protein
LLRAFSFSGTSANGVLVYDFSLNKVSSLCILFACLARLTDLVRLPQQGTSDSEGDCSALSCFPSSAAQKAKRLSTRRSLA